MLQLQRFEKKRIVKFIFNGAMYWENDLNFVALIISFLHIFPSPNLFAFHLKDDVIRYY